MTQIANSKEYAPVRPKLGLSVTIVAQDEERTIGRVIEAIKPIANEIILLDSGSTDRTVDIANEQGVKLYHQKWLGYCAQKNLAINYATNEWILSLDADEICTPELVEEIVALLTSDVPPAVNGFKIPRILFIGDEPVKGGGFYPDSQLRLIRRGTGKFAERVVHEAITVDGEVRKLKSPMLHYAYKDVPHFAAAMDKYARLSAQHYLERDFKPWKTSKLNEAIHPIWTLFYRQVVRGGMFNGPLCLQLNIIYADYVRKKIRYLRELVSARVSR